MNIFAEVFLVLILIKSVQMISDESISNPPSYVPDHRFLFISGWPQSGTSLMLQILAVAPQTSTMVEKCSKLIAGSKCTDWNFEGQWLLKFYAGKTRGAASNASTMLNPGAMCESQLVVQNRRDLGFSTILNQYKDQQNIVISDGLDRNKMLYQDGLKNTISTWGKFWNLDMPLLVEKSPHSILKSDLLRETFSGAKSIKFLVVMKHPATLNVALPKFFGWASHKVHKSREDFSVVPATPMEIEANARYFINFMTQKINGTGRDCTIGWLDVMDRFYTELTSASRRNIDTRIVRFEGFIEPLGQCQSVFKFVHNSSTSAEYELSDKSVCEKHLSPTVLAKIQRISTENKNEKQESENQKSENPKKLKIDPLNRGSRSSGSGGSGSSGRTLTGQNVGKKLRKQTRRLHQSDSRVGEDFQNSNKMRGEGEGENDIQSNYNYEDENEDENGIGGITSNLSRKDSRKLRLKWSYLPDKKLGVNLDFIPEILYESIDWRLKEYHTAYKLLPLHLQKELDIINNRLKKYGYSLDEGKELYFKTEKSIFDPWTSDS